MRNFLRRALNRATVTALLALCQVAFFVAALSHWGSSYLWVSLALRVVTLWAVIHIIWRPSNPAVKLAWVVPVLAFPLLGGVLYLFFGHVIMPKKLRESMERTDKLVKKSLLQDEEVLRALQAQDQGVANQCRYIYSYAMTPVWTNTKTRYFPDGLPFWESLLSDLEQAKRFIFLEFFILGEGAMWDSILKILERKAKEGVEVRLIYDDVGSVFLLPKHYDRILEKRGIRCVAFNRLAPYLSLVLNNRDHRKIVVVDGKIAYTGGINLADEYINYIHPYGEHWKDAGIRLQGDGVWNFTVMFLQMWNMSRYTEEDYGRYRAAAESGQAREEGFVQPYMDTPFDNETLGENVYLNLIGGAKRYFYVFTPYFVTDNEMVTAFKLAAKRGVDVRIVTPGVPDKKFVYWLTQSNYQSLIEAGIRIYQYSPGFLHAKCVLTDDEAATVGTVNFDYRSFYHHFECGVFLYRAAAVAQLKEDMEKTFALCEEITLPWCKEKFVKTKVAGPLLKLLSPLM